MVAMPDFRRSPETSLSTTSNPASAATCAMPLPIWPEPITPIFLIITAILPSRRSGARCAAHPPNLAYTLIANRSPLLRNIRSSLLSELADRLGQFRNRLIQIRHQAIIGDLEDRRVLILVDRDDDLGVLHAGEMLDRAGNTDRDIELRRHHLAGLSHLPVVRRISGIDRGARSTDAGAEFVGERLDIFGEILA